MEREREREREHDCGGSVVRLREREREEEDGEAKREVLTMGFYREKSLAFICNFVLPIVY